MIFRRIVEDYEAKLVAVDPERAGAGSRGKAEWERFAGGEEELDVDVRRSTLPDSTVLEVLLDDVRIGDMVLRGGRGELKLESRRGVEVPRAGDGARLVVALDGRALWAGVFVPD